MITVQMAPTAKMIMENVVALKKGEQVLILTDTARPSTITEVLAIMAQAVGAEVTVMMMTPREMGGVEPPPTVAAAMRTAHVIINQTSHSLTHTNAQREAIKAGARVCNIREFDEKMMIEGGVTADYVKVKDITEKLAKILTEGKRVRITTKEGTDLSFNIEGRKAFVLAGFATKPGEFSGLPDGEAAIAPLEGSTEGMIVNPYLVEKIGPVQGPLKIEVKEGMIINIEGGETAQALNDIIKRKEKNVRTFAAEFALGTNPNSLLVPKSREVKKKLGTCHVALGDNLSLGGLTEASIHLDVIMLQATVHLDGNPLLLEGKPLFL